MFFRTIMGVIKKIEMEQEKKLTIEKAIFAFWVLIGYIGKT